MVSSRKGYVKPSIYVIEMGNIMQEHNVSGYDGETSEVEAKTHNEMFCYDLWGDEPEEE